MDSLLKVPLSLNSPVLFLVFNRPETTARVFEAIRVAKPARLYVACDGPRAEKNGEAAIVAQVQEIATAVDWPCELHTLFRKENLGCKYAVSSAIDWFFGKEPSGIILEDDCLPNQSFFRFCEEILARYETNSRIMSVTGSNITKDVTFEEDSYFSIYPLMWGWATWARSWKMYDRELLSWPKTDKRNLLKAIHPSNVAARIVWRRIFETTYRGYVDTWDFQWIYSCWKEGGLTVAPSQNLVSNIGFSADATHTTEMDPMLSELPLRELPQQIGSPVAISSHKKADRYTGRYWFKETLPNAAKSLLLMSPVVENWVVALKQAIRR
ncbi:MAG: glycosyltransferase family 2 protein [Pseudomonadota bacterium]